MSCQQLHNVSGRKLKNIGGRVDTRYRPIHTFPILSSFYFYYSCVICCSTSLTSVHPFLLPSFVLSFLPFFHSFIFPIFYIIFSSPKALHNHLFLPFLFSLSSFLLFILFTSYLFQSLLSIHNTNTHTYTHLFL